MKQIGFFAVLATGVTLIVACGGSTSGDKTATGGSGGAGNVKSGGAGGINPGGAGGTVNLGGGGAGGGLVGGSGGTNFGGSGGGGNLGGTSSFKDCSSAGSCVLVPTNCCGYCSYSPISGFEAINSARQAEYMTTYCQGAACPDCVTQDNANYLALCRAGTCTAVDLTVDSLSACNDSTECRLRWGSGCCENCGGVGTDLIAYNKNANFEAEVCDPTGGSCPPCVPPEYPSYALAYCADGHCKMTIVGP